MRRHLSPASAVALVIALGMLLAATSQGAPLWAPLRDPPSRLAVLAAVVALAGVVGVGTVLVSAMVHGAILARRRSPPPFRATLLRTLPIATVAITTTALLMIAKAEPAERPGSLRAGHAVKDSDRRARPLSIDWWESNVIAGDGLPKDDESRDPGPDKDGQIPLLLILASGIAAAAGAVALRRNSSRQSEEPEEDVPAADGEAVRGAVLDTIGAMLADPEPNTAIRGAYARLLQGLDDCGTGRQAHEAPVEHIRRVLTLLRVRREPLHQLIELFELARFSTHSLGPADRDDALAALRTVAADLTANAPARLAPGSGPGTRR